LTIITPDTKQLTLKTILLNTLN